MPGTSSMSRPVAAPVGNSVYMEMTRDFRVTLRAIKRVLGEKHMLAIMCHHASLFPGDRMSARMVWDQFEALPVNQRMDILQTLRSQAR